MWFMHKPKGNVMSGPLQGLADRMSTYNTSMRFLQGEREKRDAERRAIVNKEYEKALDKSIKFSSKSEYKGRDKAEQLTPQQIKYRRDIDRICDELTEERRKKREQFHKKIEQEFSCIIL